VGAREVEPLIGPGHLRFHAGVKVRVGLDHLLRQRNGRNGRRDGNNSSRIEARSQM
jgi:hypothetical protein